MKRDYVAPIRKTKFLSLLQPAKYFGVLPKSFGLHSRSFAAKRIFNYNLNSSCAASSGEFKFNGRDSDTAFWLKTIEKSHPFEQLEKIE
jgi:hypothetical protein